MTKENVEKICKEIVDVWLESGLMKEIRAGELEGVEMVEDPVVRLLVGAVSHQTETMRNEIGDVKEQLLKNYLMNTGSVPQIKPTPSIAILQVSKMDRSGVVNEDISILDESINFSVKNTKSKAEYNFIPLLQIPILDAKVESVSRTESGRWRLEISVKDRIEDLSYIPLYFPGVSDYKSLAVYSNGKIVKSYGLDDFNSLPYITSLMGSGDCAYSKLQHQLIYNIYDSLCLIDGSYIVLSDFGQIVETREGAHNVVLELDFYNEESTFKLEKNDVKLNCVPIANISIGSVSLSKEHPLALISAENEQLMSLVGNDDAKCVDVRTIGVERQNACSWSERMRALISQYRFNYNLYAERVDSSDLRELDDKLRNLRDKMGELPNPGVYLVMRSDCEKEKIKEVKYLTTSYRPNVKLERKNDWEIEIRKSSEYGFPVKEGNSIVIKEKIGLAEVFLPLKFLGGRDAETDNQKILELAKYQYRTYDQIVTKSDIVDFCNYCLNRYYSDNERDVISVRIIPDVESKCGCSELQYVVVIKTKEQHGANEARQIERMMYPRLCSMTKVKVVFE